MYVGFASLCFGLLDIGKGWRAVRDPRTVNSWFFKRDWEIEMFGKVVIVRGVIMFIVGAFLLFSNN